MPVQIDYEILEELSKGKALNQIQNIFVTLLSELIDYLKLRPLHKNYVIKLISKENSVKKIKIDILDFGVKRIFQNDNVLIEINENCKEFLPFILLREIYYCFLPEKVSALVKICINQIVENDLKKLSFYKEWKKFLRDSLVNREFLNKQFDKLQKFFKLEANDPLESSVQFFFKEIREKTLLFENSNIDHFYDIIYERYTYSTSKSLFNENVIETLRVFIKLFFDTKSYQNLSNYYTLFKKFKEIERFDSDLSLRKFIEIMQWINKCSATIAPSYDISYNIIGLCLVGCLIRFNPLLEKYKIKKLIEELPFLSSPKVTENSFAADVSLLFIIPKVYLSDLTTYFNILESNGYIIEKNINLISNKTSFINLNYFKDISNTKKIINPNGTEYKKKFEIEHKIEFPDKSYSFPFSIFEFKILQRIHYVSTTGLTFDKRSETLNAIKDDFENDLRKQLNFIKDFRIDLYRISNSRETRKEFLYFLEKNQSKGFLYIYHILHDLVHYLGLIENTLENSNKISNEDQLRTILTINNISQIIEDNMLIQNQEIKKLVYYDIIPLYFRSKKDFKKEIEKFELFFRVLNSCYNLKILDISIIKKILKQRYSDVIEEIIKIKKERIQNLFKSMSKDEITNEKIEVTIQKFLDHEPPLIKPLLINTIFTSTFAKYYPTLFVENTPDARKLLHKLKIYFPRTFIHERLDLKTQKKFISTNIYMINIKEKELFISILYRYLRKSILSVKRYFWRGVERASDFQYFEFYDFENKNFFYLKDIFEQLLIFSQNILGKKMRRPKFQLDNNFQEFFWETTKDINDLVSAVQKRIYNYNSDFDSKKIIDLIEFRKNLGKIISNTSKITDIKNVDFFQIYVNSINFLPLFRKFGVSQYNLYFRPFHYNSINFKILFANSFQEIKYPASIDPNQMIYSSYIFPYRKPNTSYLNWLVKSKKVVSEYCLFYRKKFYEIFQFDQNLKKAGWDYSSMRFKSYVQNVLFNPSYDPKIQNIKEFDFDSINDSDVYGPKSKEFNTLFKIYNRYSIDIKSYLGTKKYTTINYITDLLKKKLIFPYLSLKNLDFQDKVSIILPNVKNEFNEKIIKIFSFFNMCHIYEIEGELYIYGFEDIKSFENGFLIEIWFPKCEMDEFFEVFDLIFQYFEIKHYLILTDLVDGRQLLKSVYGNLEFLDSYNPLKNLIWNDKDKIWMNHKLFNEKFEPIYPDLLYGEKREN